MPPSSTAATVSGSFQVGLLDREVGKMDHLSRLKHVGQDAAIPSPQGCAPAFLDQRQRRVVCGGVLKRLPIAQIHIAEIRLADAGCVREHGVKHRLQLAGRAG